MSQTARPGATGIGVPLVCAALLAACYQPSVVSGGLKCAVPPAKACPDGFACAAGVCVDSTSHTGGAPGAGGHAGVTGGGGHVGSGGVVATGGGGGSGSGGVAGSGGTGTPDGGQGPGVGEACAITNRGEPDQSDNCAPGGICVDDCFQSVCYRVCGSDADCPGSSCTRTAGTSGTKVCEVTFTTCDPHAQDGMQGCNAPTTCYLLSSTATASGDSRTVCDCSTGAQGPGDPCTDSRDCFPRLVCPPASVPGGGACRQVCDPSALLTGCTLSTCYPYGPRWGYCF